MTGDSQLNDVSLYELEKRYRVKILICAVQRGDDVYIPRGDFILRAGDRIHITGTRPEISTFIKEVGIVSDKIRSTMIIGGGRVAYYLARMMAGSGMRVKIIEQDEKRCIELSESLEKTEIIHGDGSDHDTLADEGIDETDAVVALTGIDEENIIIALYANSKKVKKTIAKVSRSELFRLVENLNVDSIISPKEITADYILRYVRAMQNTTGSNVLTLYRIVEDKAEALEFRVTKVGVYRDSTKGLESETRFTCRRYYSWKQPHNPRGHDTIEADDRVIIITKNLQLKDLDDILLRG